MNTRWCNKCQQEKPLEEFGRNRTKPLGYGYTCKACIREYWRKRDKRPERIEKSKRWLHSENGKRHYREYQRQYKERVRAHQMIKRLIIKGIIKKEPCILCGENNSSAHHPDYTKPLEVVWLCQKHHSEKHRRI